MVMVMAMVMVMVAMEWVLPVLQALDHELFT
jgi:hypothetical protein